MAGVSPSVAVVRDMHTLFASGTRSGESNRQLLERFIDRRDPAAEVAFEALVLRHGPLVLRTCRNLLRDASDVEDAFQATFLVLVRRCGSIRRRESIAGWLFGVACRVALRARYESARRRAAETGRALRVLDAIDLAGETEPDQAELGLVVQEEVRRLPEKYRAVVVLSYWHGWTHEEAAARLGCPLGTVRSRIARARDLLQRRLTRRGFAPLAGAVVSALDSSPTSAAAVAVRLGPLAPDLVCSTIRAATEIAAGRAAAQVVRPLAAYLIQRTIWSMTMIKLSSMVLGMALAGLAAFGVGAAVQRGRSPAGPQAVGRVTGGTQGQGASVEQAQPGGSGKRGSDEHGPDSGGGETVFCRFRGETVIISVLPDRSMVKKGQVVCALDSAGLQDQLVREKILSRMGMIRAEQARLEREIAELAVVEYEEGLYVRDLLEANGSIALAHGELARAEDEYESARKEKQADRKKWMVADQARKKAIFELERAEARKKVLVQYTKERKVKELKLAVKKARLEETAQKANWELELSNEKALEFQIRICTLKSPVDGTLV
jgi:HlyD family secretion protein